MGDSDSGVGVKPGVDSIFWQFGVGVGTGVKHRSRNRSQHVGLESESEPGLTGVAHLWLRQPWTIEGVIVYVGQSWTIEGVLSQ